MKHSDFMYELECLNLGILGPGISRSSERESINSALALLSPEDSRKMRRKFRKVARQIIFPESWKKMTRKQKRNRVHREMYIQCILRSYNMGYSWADNDV